MTVGPRTHPLVVAHRGASGYRPEHTRAAYELAISQGVDAVEPDIVATSDGVLVVRHENEISGTTDVAAHLEFADRRTAKMIDGSKLTGWFTEDFSWAELASLRTTERIPKIRRHNTAFSGQQGILRLTDLFDLLDGADRGVGMVAEIKHASYFDSIGLPLDELFAAELTAAGWDDDARLTIESFEPTVLGRIRERGIRGDLVFLLEATGAPADRVAVEGAAAMRYPAYLSTNELARLATAVDGISVDKDLLLRTDSAGNLIGVTDLVERAHSAGLSIFCWTLRAENKFLARNLRSGSSAGAFGDWMTEFQLIMRSGIDGVFTDQPDLALEARRSL